MYVLIVMTKVNRQPWGVCESCCDKWKVSGVYFAVEHVVAGVEEGAVAERHVRVRLDDALEVHFVALLSAAFAKGGAQALVSRAILAILLQMLYVQRAAETTRRS